MTAGEELKLRWPERIPITLETLEQLPVSWRIAVEQRARDGLVCSELAGRLWVKVWLHRFRRPALTRKPPGRAEAPSSQQGKPKGATRHVLERIGCR